MNFAELKMKLNEISIPQSAYALPGDNLDDVIKNGGHSLEYNAEIKRWIISKYSRFGKGRKEIVDGFYSEAAACETLYYLLGRDYCKENRLVFEENSEINFRTMIAELIKNGVPPWRRRVQYFLSASEEDYSLEYDFQSNTWQLFYYERGTKKLIKSFHTESAACLELYSYIIS